MKRMVFRLMKQVVCYFQKCRYCGYSGSDWSDSGECPNCGEVNQRIKTAKELAYYTHINKWYVHEYKHAERALNT